MKLIQKLNLLSVLFISITSITIVLILRITSTVNYSEVEQQVHETYMNSYYEIVSQYIEQLDYVLWDWTEWDATYDYIEGNYVEYIDDNLPAASFDNFGLDYIAIYDENMTMLYGNAFIEEDYELIPLPEELVQPFISTGVATGILALDEELILYSGKSITDNEGTKPPKGLMIFAYRLDEDVNEALADALGTEFSVEFLASEPTADEKFQNLTPDEENPYSLMVSLAHGVNEPGIGRIDIPYLNQNGALRLEFDLGQSIQDLGRQQIQTSLIMVLASLIVLNLLMAIAIKHMIISRVTRLNSQVNKITNSKNVKGRVKVSGIDELGELSEGINEMLIEIDLVHDEANWYANHDELTGAYNRRAGFNLIEDTMKTIDEKGGNLTVTYIDIDGLKRVNDSYGHLEGDRLITDMVQLMKDNISDQCHIVRIGGDEFVIACIDLDISETLVKLNELQEKVKAFNEEASRVYKVSYSHGIATYRKGMEVDALIEEADQKMYKDRRIYRELARH